MKFTKKNVNKKIYLFEKLLLKQIKGIKYKRPNLNYKLKKY